MYFGDKVTHFPKPFLTLLAALSLTACEPAIETPLPINPDTNATFGIHAVLHAADGTVATTLPDQYVLGEDVERMLDPNGTALFVMQPAEIGTDCLQKISAAKLDYGGPVLNFTLTPDCTQTFGRMTGQNIGKRFAVVLNGELVTAPYIRAPITGGAGYIEGGFENLAEAEAIARQFY